MSDGSPKWKRYRFAIRRPVAVAMFFVTLIVFGWKSYQQLPVNLMPNISYPTLTVRTEYEAAAPEDVEKLVTRPLEEALSIVSGLVEISSVSSPGISEIILEFTWGTDMNLALQEVRDRLDLFEPPKEVTEKPVILRYDPTLDPVLRVAITGSDFSDEKDPAKQKALRQG
jgi:hydrophobic/amphiphilic exporter-1 (mainly G- bacteria), HAE1 family